LPEGILLSNSAEMSYQAVLSGLEKYASFAEKSGVAKAVDEALGAEKKGLDPGQLGNALLQIAVNSPFNVES
jgi:hypothetical protein